MGFSKHKKTFKTIIKNDIMKNRNSNKLLLLSMYVLCSINSVFGQVENRQEVLLNKNAIYGNVGSGGLYFTATGYFERMIKQQMCNRNISSFVKIGFGGEVHWGEGGVYVLAQYGLLTGVKTHHLEIGLGPNFFISGDLKGELPISGTVGWRIQKPGGNFIFRTGASWPEAIYIGLGFAF